SALLTVTDIAVEGVVRPLVSRATALMLCSPLPTVCVFNVNSYGAVVSSAPTLLPSTRNCTPATATLSPAVAVRLVVPDTVAPAAGAVTDTVGGVMSGLLTVIETAAEGVVSPLVSRATALMLWSPLPTVRLSQVKVYGAVVSSAPTLLPSTRN